MTFFLRHFPLSSFFFKNNLFIWLRWVLVAVCQLFVAVCGIQFPGQGLNLGPLSWKHGILATRPPGKSHILFLRWANLSSWVLENLQWANLAGHSWVSIKRCLTWVSTLQSGPQSRLLETTAKESGATENEEENCGPVYHKERRQRICEGETWGRPRVLGVKKWQDLPGGPVVKTLPANAGAQVQALTQGDSTCPGGSAPGRDDRSLGDEGLVQPKAINQTFKKRNGKKKKEIHSYACIQMNNSPKNKDLGLCAKPPWARRLTSGLPFVPKHCFFPASTVLLSLAFLLIYLFIFLASHHVFFPISIQFAGQFCLFIISRSLSCLCACHRKGPTYHLLGLQQ